MTVDSPGTMAEVVGVDALAWLGERGRRSAVMAKLKALNFIVPSYSECSFRYGCCVYVDFFTCITNAKDFSVVVDW